jgi:hypothetical protein
VNATLVVEMTAMWIILGLGLLGAVAWRLRTASAKVDRILREESDLESERLPASHDR